MRYASSYGPIPGSQVYIHVDPDEEDEGYIVTIFDGIEVVATFPLFDERDGRIIARMFLEPFGRRNPFD